MFIKYMLLGYNLHVRQEKSDLSCPREDLLNPFGLTWIYIHLVKRVFRKESKVIGQTLHHIQEG